jgi:ABC-2 type transport system permease protein
MVAQLLRLKLRLLGNIFRRSTWQVVGIVVGLIYGLGAAVFAFVVLTGLRGADDVALVRDAVVVAGAVTVVGFLLVPLVFGVDDTMDPRRFSLFGIADRTLALGLALAAMIGVPALALAIALSGTVVTWSRGVGETLVALLAAPLAFATCLLGARITAGLGGLLLETRRSRDVAGVIGVLLVVMAAPLLVALSTVDWAASGRRTIGAIAGALSWTPLGAAFAAPGDAAAGAWGPAILKLVIAVATVWIGWMIWERLVARMLVTPGREAAVRSYHGLGWFGRMPHGATGAIAARSITYWFRDARYWVALIMVPITPILVAVPLGIAGVPAMYLGLIPVPLVCLLLGWSLHNDTAYDSTAVWLHVASGVRGVADRIGRLVPVLISGILVIGLGSAVTVFVLDDWRLLPSLLGVSTALLLAGLGLGSITSAAMPYPVVKPGDSPFQAPQSTGALTALVQSFTMFGSLLVAAPAIAFAGLGIFSDPAWHAASLAAGVGLGALVLFLGVWSGGRLFERRGPEILAAAVRA